MDKPPKSREEAKAHINQIRKRRGLHIENDEYSHEWNINHEDLEAAVSILAEGLYEESSHFLLEMIQNADDCHYDSASSPTMNITYGNGRLRIDYNELGFTIKDVEAITRVTKSTKVDSATQTGEKGIGFKSVFKIADVVHVNSGPYSFKFDKTKRLGMVTPKWEEFPAEPQRGYTSIMLHLRSDDEEKDLIDAMNAMSSKILMFLRRLRTIWLSVTSLDGTTWSSSLERSDMTIRGEHITNLRQDGTSSMYIVRKHTVKDLPTDPKRGDRTESDLCFAFPITEDYMARIEPQSVYAYLPIRDYGFKFLVQADFLLIANRGDIDKSSRWNRALCDAMVDVLLGDIHRFNLSPLRYTWPRYLPDNRFLGGDLFDGFRLKLMARLVLSPVLESEDENGPFSAPCNLYYVPESFCGEKGTPLTRSAKTISKYLSCKYSHSDWEYLENIGVRGLTNDVFLQDLRESLCCRGFMPEPEDAWHLIIAKLLCPLMSTHKAQLVELPLILLTNRNWVSASSGTIFFPGERGASSVPEGIEVFEAHPDAQRDGYREHLYRGLGVKPFSISDIQRMVIAKLSQSWLTSSTKQSELISQTIFLFRTQWKRPLDEIQLPILTTVGTLLPSWEVYIHTNGPYYASRYLKKHKESFFVHRGYEKRLASEEKGQWNTWLQDQLGLHSLPRLVLNVKDEAARLSAEFYHILQIHGSWKLLVLLRDNWTTYSRDFSSPNKADGKVHPSLRKEMGLIQVTCHGGNLYALEQTSTGYSLPRDLLEEILQFRQPFLDIPDPRDSRWDILRNFGVTAGDNISTYLKVLDSIQGHQVSIELVSWLYRKIEANFQNDPDGVKKLFQVKRCIYVPEGITKTACRWVSMTECVWSGPNCLESFHKLDAIYPYHGGLFKEKLKIRDADVDTLVSELTTVTMSTALRRIIDLLFEIEEAIKNNHFQTLTSIGDLLQCQVFPLDEGSDSTRGFDDLSRATADSEWYVADLPHLRSSFRGVVSLLAVTVDDLKRIPFLCDVLGLKDRYISKIAKGTPIVHGEEIDSRLTDDFRSKYKFLDRLTPESISSRAQMIDQLKNIEVRLADKVLIKWWIKSTLRSSEDIYEGHVYDDGLQSAIMPSAHEKQLRVWLLKAANPSCLPLELSEQIATFCGIPKEAGLVYFILSQDNLSDIEQALDRRGVPRVRNTNPIQKRARGHTAQVTRANRITYGKFDKMEREVWVAGVESRQEGVDDQEEEGEEDEENEEVEEEGGEEKAKQEEEEQQDAIEHDIEPSDLSTRSTEFNSQGLHVELNEYQGNSSVTKSDNPLTPEDESNRPSRLQYGGDDSSPVMKQSKASHEDISRKRPNYVALDEVPEMKDYISQREERPRQIMKDSNAPDLSDLKPFERGRVVGTPRLIFVSNRRQLPHEEFPSKQRRGAMLPGRVQISPTGDCTVFAAVQPTYMTDEHVEYLGELYVSRLLERYLGAEYNPDVHWTSYYRRKAGYAPFIQNRRPVTPFLLSNRSGKASAAMKDLLIQSGMTWKPNYDPLEYYILVKITTGGQESPFAMSVSELDLIRRLSIQEGYGALTRPRAMLVRVYDMAIIPSASFFVDPWDIYASGYMKLQAENSSFIAEIRRCIPDLSFEDLRLSGKPYARSMSHKLATFMSSLINPDRGVRARSELANEELRYPYAALQEASVRLLRLYPGKIHDELVGDLEPVMTDSLGLKSFSAVSYVWGSKFKPFVLRIKGSQVDLRITAPLYAVLKRLRQTDDPVYLWADAICIDQENLQERAHQVRLMGNVYRSAEHVYAWLGDAADDSELAITWLMKMQREDKLSPESAGPVLPPTESEVWDAMHSFFSRDWFRRVWIVQELVLGSKVIMMCGDNRLDWEAIYTPALVCAQEAEKSSAATMKHISRSVTPVLSLGKLRRAYHDVQEPRRNTQQDLLSLLKDFDHTQATEVRDKLFAFLGLAYDGDDPGFYPDYESSLEDVVHRYAGVFVCRGRGMELLYQAGLSHSWPGSLFASWVPNWVTTTVPRTITTWRSMQGRFCAGSHLWCDLELSPTNETILVSKACIVDRIDSVGRAASGYPGTINFLKILFNYIESLPSYPTGENPRDLAWKIPIGDASDPPYGSWNEVDFGKSYQALKEYIQLGDETTDWQTEFSSIRAMAKMKQFLFRPQELRRLMWSYIFTAQEFVDKFVDPRICITKRGYVGIVPGTAQVDDLVVVLHGSAVPFILQAQEGTSHYYHLGESYIHGIMHGEICSFDDIETRFISLA